MDRKDIKRFIRGLRIRMGWYPKPILVCLFPPNVPLNVLQSTTKALEKKIKGYYTLVAHGNHKEGLKFEFFSIDDVDQSKIQDLKDFVWNQYNNIKLSNNGPANRKERGGKTPSGKRG